MKTPDNRRLTTDDPPALNTETLDDLDPQQDTDDINGGMRTCEGCTRTCATYS
jgi:hypothetical protein